MKRQDGMGGQTEYAYILGEQIREIRRGHSGKQQILQSYEYNARGQIIGITDGVGEKVDYDVDSWGRITGINFSDGVKEGYEYTPSGQISKATDGNGNSVTYQYNSLGKVRARIDQLGNQETFQYDEEGNLALHIDRDGNQITRNYNVFGNPVYERAVDKNGGHAVITTYRYDSLGRLTRAICDGHSYEYEYNENGRLKEKRSSGKRLISYEYDKAGQITAMTDPAGVTTCYEYDLLGRTSRIYTDQGMEVQYRYDCLNRLERIVYGNGMKTCYQYDENGNVSYLETRMGEEKLLSFAYEYDGNGNRVSKAGEQSQIDGGSSHVRTTYQYNVRGQLLEEKRNEDTFCYSYDAAGNRIKKEDSKGDTSYHYNEKNQLISEEGIRGRKFFTYNHQGSIIREDGPIETRSFTYNTRNQQVKVECEDGWTQVNRYDPEGLRYEMKENEKLFRFIYHRGELLYEGGKEEQTSYHLGGGTEAIQRNEKIYYYHKDEQLSTALITDEEGQVRNQYQYHAFGEEFETQECITNRIRYTGQQYDGISGQYYLRARFYNPSLGRFMQEDPYHGDGLNLYAYCGNNPVTYYDPSGYTGQNPNSNCPPTANIKGDGVENTKGTGEEISVPVTEEFYRTMSEKEYAKLLENEALTKRDKGASELKVTQESGYVTNDLSQRTNQGKKYTQIVKFEVDEGTKIVLESIGAAHPSVAENPIYASLPAVGTSEAKGMVEIKYEKNQTLSYGLGSSEKGLALFNENTKKISVLNQSKNIWEVIVEK